jgi:hypothetical protein
MLNGKHSIMIHESQFPFEFLPATLDGADMVSERIELLSIYGFQIFISLTLGYVWYTVMIITL